jgi:adenine/guanine phosphoribosyltransferase-like PRPP-binding protein
MSDLLAEVQVPDMAGALRSLSEMPKQKTAKDLFGTKKHGSWNKDLEARCNFEPKIRLNHRADVWFFALWQKSITGRTLTEIKADEKEIPHFADAVSDLIKGVIGEHLSDGDWCIVTTPKRRHKERNFATLVAIEIGRKLCIPFYEDVASCSSRHRVDAVFDLQFSPPEKNVILFDDFVTTGSTLKAMKAVLESVKKNVLSFTGINNKL